MAHTNETANYHLSQFVGTDIPNPLTDYNGDMEKIDTALKTVADSAVSEDSRVTALETQNGSEVLTTTAQTLSGAINELDGDVGDIDTRLITAEGKIIADESNISTLAGKVSGLETKVGSAVLTTVAADCSGAINELNSKIKEGYIVQELTYSSAADGTKTFATQLNELATAFAAVANADTSGAFYRCLMSTVGGNGFFFSPTSKGYNSENHFDAASGLLTYTAPSSILSYRISFNTNLANCSHLRGTIQNDGTVSINDVSSNVANNDAVLVVQKYVPVG